MKAIMISIKPKYVADILNHKKTIEIRKTMPKCDLPIDVYIYCTKDKKSKVFGFADRYSVDFITSDRHRDTGLSGYVVAKFTLKRVYEITDNSIGEILCANNVPPIRLWLYSANTCDFKHRLQHSQLLEMSCLEDEQLRKYLKNEAQHIGKIDGYAWYISNLEIFDKPKELSEFKSSVWLRNEYISPNPVCDMCKFPNCKKCERHYCLVPLTKAPQSWCYVEDLL